MELPLIYKMLLTLWMKVSRIAPHEIKIGEQNTLAKVVETVANENRGYGRPA